MNIEETLGKMLVVTLKTARMVLDVTEEQFYEFLIANLHFDLKDSSNRTHEGIKSAFHRGLPSKYYEDAIKLLEKISSEANLYKDDLSKKYLANLTYSYTQLIKTVYRCVYQIDTFYLPDDFESPRMVEGFDPAFSYRLNKCFSALSTLTKNDIYFLGLCCKGNLKKEDLNSVLSLCDVSPYQIVVNCKSDKARKWIRAQKYFLPNINVKQSDNVKNWKNFIRKFNKLERITNCKSQESYNNKRMWIFFFLYLIWPEDGAKDTSIGSDVFDMFLCFQTCFTPEAQEKLINKLRI